MRTHTLALTFIVAAVSAGAQAEDFANVNHLFTTGDWVQYNMSNPQDAGHSDPWGQGDASVFSAYTGAPDSYISANYTAAGNANSNNQGTISAWLFAPTRTWSNGDTISFATRTAGDSFYADRLQVRLSTSGSSVNVGWNEFTVGNFDNLLLDINPTLEDRGYPHDWTVYTATISGLSQPSFGRIGFRYFVENGGAGGVNSNIVGIDDYNVKAVPEPASMAALGLGVAALIRRRRMAR